MIQLKNLLNFLFLASLVVVDGKIEIVLEGSIENCADGRNYDLSKLEFVPYNDTHMFLNGKYHNFC